MPSPVFLGPNLNFWCNYCNIPILEVTQCPICESKLKKLQIAPPFEVTPAFERDLNLIRQVIDTQYGLGVGMKLIPPDKIILLNKAPYYDRMDEIIVDGYVIGNIRFNPTPFQWEFVPKIEGARRLVQLTKKKWLKIDDGAINHIARGANVLAPGIIDFDQEFEKDDYLIILTSENQAIATGPTKYSASTINTIKRGMIVKTKDHAFPKDPEIRAGGQNWDDVIKANEGVLKKRETQAHNFIKKSIKKFEDLPVTISFSGGKDSLCLLLLVLDALGPTDIYFIDTGIEFEETKTFTREIIKEFGLEDRFTYKCAKESFWENLEKFGPPAKDFRWCCKTNKLANITEFLSEKYPGQRVVTFIGSRQYESVSRYHDKKIWTNSFLPQQIGISPIHKWPALHIWMFLLWKKVKINPLYFEGYKRIGCIYCPATKLSELQLLKELHPELYDRWIQFLNKWAKKYGLSPEWAERGFWRWRKFREKGQINLALEIGIPEEKIIWQQDEKLKFRLVKGFSSCQDGSFSVEGRIEGYLNLLRIANMLNMLGPVKNSQELGIISLRTENYTLNLYSDGTFTFRSQNQEESEGKLQLIQSLIKRANECIGCGICIPICPENALSLRDNKIWVNKSCTACLICLEKCPILKYK